MELSQIKEFLHGKGDRLKDSQLNGKNRNMIMQKHLAAGYHSCLYLLTDLRNSEYYFIGLSLEEICILSLLLLIVVMKIYVSFKRTSGISKQMA